MQKAPAVNTIEKHEQIKFISQLVFIMRNGMILSNTKKKRR